MSITTFFLLCRSLGFLSFFFPVTALSFHLLTHKIIGSNSSYFFSLFQRDTSIIGRNSLFRHVRKHARIIEDKMNRCQAGAIQAPESFVSSS